MPFALPTHWRWVKLGELGRVVGGGTPKSGDTSMWAVAGHSWLTPADLYGLKVKAIGRGRRDISIRGLNESSAQLLPTGTVLFSSRAPIGYVAIAANPLATNQGFKSCVLHISEVGDYLYWYLKHAARSIDAVASGTTFKEISGAQFARIWVPLPPLAEQHRIVARVEELMKLCDALEQNGRLADEQHARLTSTLFDALAASESAHALADNWQRVAEHFDLLLDRPEAVDAFEQTVLQLAVRGLLVPKQRSCDEWPQAAMGDAVELLNGYAFKSEWFRSTGVRLVRNVNVAHGALDWGEKACVDESVARELSRFALSEGDVLVSLDRPIISTGLKYAKVRLQDMPCLLLQRVARLKPHASVLTHEYLELWLNSPDFIKSIDPGRSNGVPHISTRQLQALSLSLPPLAEQHRIVARVEELRGLCAQLRERLTDARRTQSQLADALVAEIV